MAPRPGCGGLILCGGRSSRMGYDKLRLRFPGGSLLDRMLHTLGRVVQPIVLSLAPGQATGPLPPDVRTVKDGVANQGPLWGLTEGFRALQGQCERVVVMPVDLPFLTPAWVERLLDGLDEHTACAYQHEGFINALTAAYSIQLLPKLETLLGEGRRRPLFILEGENTRILQAAAVEAPGAGATPIHPLMDVDTPEAYRAALLHEGIGRRNAPEIVATLHTRASQANRLPAGLLALHAERVEDLLHWAHLLYPELDLRASDHTFVIRQEEGRPPVRLKRQEPLLRGEHLRIEIGLAPATSAE